MNVVAIGTLALACAGGFALDACSGSHVDTPQPSDDAGNDATVATAIADGSAAPDVLAPKPVHVTFAYNPGWAGVKNVEVVGGFGLASDWSKTQSLVTLTDDGRGTFTGAVDLPPGNYLYLLRVRGDDASATPNLLTRYVLDPSQPTFDACPPQAPIYSKTVANPCSRLTVPQAPAATKHTIKGVVHVDGAAAAGWLVQLDRNEPGSHAWFVDRVTTKNDGSFAIGAAPGVYRLQLLHPTYLTQTDYGRDPIALAALRRTVSSNFPLTADLTASQIPDLGFHDYTLFAPRDAGTLPMHFTFGDGGGVPARLAVYGGAVTDAGQPIEIGDPWFLAPQTSTTGADFDGGFNTKAAPTTGAETGQRYFWGTMQIAVGPDGGIKWSGQTMVFPIVWR